MPPILRRAGLRDAPAVTALLAHEITCGVAHFGTELPTVAELEAQIAGTGVHPFRVAEVEGRVVAFARASPWKPRGAYGWTTELGIYVDPAHQRSGLGRLLVEEVIDRAVAVGFRTLMAGIVVPNPGSVALFERLGFEQVGSFPAMGWKHGAWRDVGYWSRRVGDGPPGPLTGLLTDE